MQRLLLFASAIFCVVILGRHAAHCMPTILEEENSIQGIDRAMLARDTQRLCYVPHLYSSEQTCKIYVFGTSFNNTWQPSREFCLGLSDILGVPMDLAAIESREENDAIKEVISTHYSGKEFHTSGVRVWRNSTLMHWAATGYGVTYYNWVAGQPAAILIDYSSAICISSLGWHEQYTNYTPGLMHYHHPLCEENP